MIAEAVLASFEYVGYELVSAATKRKFTLRPIVDTSHLDCWLLIEEPVLPK